MTQPAPENVSTSRPAEITPSKAEGVDIAGAIEAFKKERAKDAKEDVGSSPADALKKPDDGVNDKAESGDVTDKPEAATQTAAVDVPEKEQLKVKLRAKVAARQRELEAREQRLAQWEAENKQRAELIDAENKRIGEERARYERLQLLKQTNPREYLKETGVKLADLVQAELAEMSPEARSKQMAKTLEELPSLIERKAEELLQKKLAEREQKQTETQKEQERRAAIVASEQRFVERVQKEADKFPSTAKVAERDPRFAVHTAYYIQSVFLKEHGRPPSDYELDKNVELYLANKVYGDAEAPTKTKTGGRTSPRASAKEVTEKPLSEMTNEERMAAAAKEFRRIREADKAEE